MRITGRPFQWIETSGGRRHATADEDVREGRGIVTLCGYRVTAERWHGWPYPTCLDCETVWRQVEGLPLPYRERSAVL